MTSLIAAIRAAVRPGSATPVLDEVEDLPDATASIPQTPPLEATTTGGAMSGSQTAAGAAIAATEAIAAVSAASGGADGYNAAMTRIDAVLSADSIKGDAKRMTAALDLAKASPGMSAEAVIAFVTANVPATNAAAPSQPSAQAETYEQRRMAAAALAQPGEGQPAPAASINRGDIFAARRKAAG